MPRNSTHASQWLEKAMAHRDAVAALLDRSPPLTELACFHMHQCVDTSLKAVLVKRNIDLPDTRDLNTLLDLLGSHGPADVPRRVLAAMSDYALMMDSLGGEPPSYDQLDGIIDAMDGVLGWAQRELG